MFKTIKLLINSNLYKLFITLIILILVYLNNSMLNRFALHYKLEVEKYLPYYLGEKRDETRRDIMTRNSETRNQINPFK